MMTLFPINLTCPVCGSQFESQEIGSCGFASKRTDFRPNYWGLNPTEYFFHLCPNCGFCAGKSNFEETINNPEFKQKMDRVGSLKEVKPSNKLAQAAKCLEAMHECHLQELTDLKLGETWILAYWWSENPKDEAIYGDFALAYFKKAFQTETVPEEEIPTITYLMGEINRRLGRKAEASTFFDKALILAGKKKESQFIAKMVKQQKESPKDDLD
jgi:uncharacterized protein (DUF2225 family)